MSAISHADDQQIIVFWGDVPFSSNVDRGALLDVNAVDSHDFGNVELATVRSVHKEIAFPKRELLVRGWKETAFGDTHCFAPMSQLVMSQLVGVCRRRLTGFSACCVASRRRARMAPGSVGSGKCDSRVRQPQDFRDTLSGV